MLDFIFEPEERSFQLQLLVDMVQSSLSHQFSNKLSFGIALSFGSSPISLGKNSGVGIRSFGFSESRDVY